MSKTNWLPSRNVNVSATLYNHGLTTMIRVNGPSGEVGWAPLRFQDDNIEQMVQWTKEVFEAELRVVLKEMLEEAKELKRVAWKDDDE